MLLCCLQMELEQPCDRHIGQSGHIPVPECKLPLDTDFFVACAPCQPYSLQRAGSGPKRPCDHVSFGSLWGPTGSVLSTLTRVRPKVFVSENVIGFQEFRRDLIDNVMGIKDPNTRQAPLPLCRLHHPRQCQMDHCGKTQVDIITLESERAAHEQNKNDTEHPHIIQVSFRVCGLSAKCNTIMLFILR